MMSSAHSFLVHVPNWAGFAVLIGVWIAFRGFLLRSRRRTLERMQMGRAMPSVPLRPGEAAYGQIRCPRCSASAPAVAAYCPHCGLSFASMPPPIPVRVATPPARNGLLMLVWVLLGVIGLAAYVFWRVTPDEGAATPQPPEQTHHHYHYP